MYVRHPVRTACGEAHRRRRAACGMSSQDWLETDLRSDAEQGSPETTLGMTG